MLHIQVLAFSLCCTKHARQLPSNHDCPPASPACQPASFLPAVRLVMLAVSLHPACAFVRMACFDTRCAHQRCNIAPATHMSGSKLRTDLTRDGGVATVASTPSAVRDAKALLGGLEEQVSSRSSARACCSNHDRVLCQSMAVCFV